MRLYKVLLSASILAASTMMLSSCLKDQDDVFDVDANNRLEQRLADCKNTLISSEYGWAFDYFPDRNISFGGFVYGLKFTETDVTVSCELAPGMTETSLYKMTNDNGPVLSFDSYNTLMHFFATPDGDNYEAYDGDFEFIIMDVKPDLITLRGNRTGNTMYLRRLTEDHVQYVNKAAEVGGNIFQTEFLGTCGNEAVSAMNDLGVRYMEFQWQEEEKQDNGETMMVAKASGAYYVPTPTGIRFMEPVQLSAGSGEVTELTYDNSTFILSGTDSNGNAVSMKGQVAANYSRYDEFIGNFTISDAASSIDIQIVADGTGSGYLIKGLTKACDIVATYNKSAGAINICNQTLGQDSQSKWMLLGTVSSGSFYPNASGKVGMMAIKDVDNPGTFVFTDNGDLAAMGVSNVIVGFKMIEAYGGKYYLSADPYNFINGKTSLDSPVKLIKK